MKNGKALRHRHKSEKTKGDMTNSCEVGPCIESVKQGGNVEKSVDFSSGRKFGLPGFDKCTMVM